VISGFIFDFKKALSSGSHTDMIYLNKKDSATGDLAQGFLYSVP